MKCRHFGPFSLEYLLWDDTREDFAMKFVHRLLLGDGIGIRVFFFLYNYVLNGSWIVLVCYFSLMLAYCLYVLWILN